MIKRGTVLFLFAVLMLGLGSFTPTTNAAADDAMVTVVHASPDAPGVDIYVDGQKAVTNLKFGEATGYVNLPAGQRKVQVFATGTGPSGTAVINATLPLEAGKAYTVAAVNVLAKIEPLVISDDLARPAAGKAHIRVVHASPDAPAVDVGVKGGPTPFTNAPFKAATKFTPVDAGSYTFEVRPTGTTQAVLTVGPVNLEAGKIYTVFALGQVGNNTLKAVPFVYTPAAMPGIPATGGGGMAERNGLESAAVATLLFLALALAWIRFGRYLNLRSVR